MGIRPKNNKWNFYPPPKKNHFAKETLLVGKSNICWKNVAKFICFKCTRISIEISFTVSVKPLVYLPHIIWSLFIYYGIVTYLNFSRPFCILCVLWIIPLFMFFFLCFYCLWVWYRFWDLTMTKTQMFERNTFQRLGLWGHSDYIS